MRRNWKHSSSFVCLGYFLFPAHRPLQMMVCCFLFFFLVVWDTVRCLSKDDCETVCDTMHSDVNGLLSALVIEAVTNQQWRWRGRNQFTARKTTMAVVLGSQCSLGVFFIAQMSVFLNSLLTGKGVKGILNVQITEHVLLFKFSSICELLTAGCNHVSCWFVVSVTHYFSFLWLLSSLFTQGKQKGKLNQEEELWNVALIENTLPGLALGTLYMSFSSAICENKKSSAFLNTLQKLLLCLILKVTVEES